MISTAPIVIWLDINPVLVNRCFSDPESPSAHSSPSEEAAPVFMNGGGPDPEINGHIPVRKRYIESSLDELAMEIEAYEANGEKPKHASYENGVDTVEQHDEPELMSEPPAPIVVMATPVVEPVLEKVKVKEAVEEPVKLVEVRRLKQSLVSLSLLKDTIFDIHVDSVVGYGFVSSSSDFYRKLKRSK